MSYFETVPTSLAPDVGYNCFRLENYLPEFNRISPGKPGERGGFKFNSNSNAHLNAEPRVRTSSLRFQI